MDRKIILWEYVSEITFVSLKYEKNAFNQSFSSKILPIVMLITNHLIQEKCNNSRQSWKAIYWWLLMIGLKLHFPLTQKFSKFYILSTLSSSVWRQEENTPPQLTTHSAYRWIEPKYVRKKVNALSRLVVWLQLSRPNYHAS